MSNNLSNENITTGGSVVCNTKSEYNFDSAANMSNSDIGISKQPNAPVSKNALEDFIDDVNPQLPKRSDGGIKTVVRVTSSPAKDEDAASSKYRLTTSKSHFDMRQQGQSNNQRNVTSKNLAETVKALTDEMKTLSKQKAKTESHLNNLKKDNTRIQDKLSSLNSARKAQVSDSKTLDVLRKNNNEMAKRWDKEKKAKEEEIAREERTTPKGRVVGGGFRKFLKDLK